MEKKSWYAIYTKSRQEKKVAELMQKNGFEVYLPLTKQLRQWSDRKKMVEVPLISMYVFVNVSEREYYDILNTSGVVCYVTFEGKAAPIRSSEIEAMRLALAGTLPVELIAEAMVAGQKVKIVGGPMKGAEGEYVFTKQKTYFIINMSQIGFSLRVEVSAADVVKI